MDWTWLFGFIDLKWLVSIILGAAIGGAVGSAVGAYIMPRIMARVYRKMIVSEGKHAINELVDYVKPKIREVLDDLAVDGELSEKAKKFIEDVMEDVSSRIGEKAKNWLKESINEIIGDYKGLLLVKHKNRDDEKGLPRIQ